MNLPTDKELDDYLSGGSDVSRRYRALATEEPPVELDRAVLSQAREAVESVPPMVTAPPRRRRVSHWAVPLAAAATLVLSVLILRDLGPDLVTRRMAQPAAAPVAPQADAAVALEARQSSLLEEEKPSSVVLNNEGKLEIDSPSRKLRDRKKQNNAAFVPPAAGREKSIQDVSALAGASTGAIASVDAAATVPAAATPPAPQAEKSPVAERASLTEPVLSRAASGGVREVLMKSKQPSLPAQPYVAASVPQEAKPIAADALRARDTAAPSPVPSRPPEDWLEDIRKLRADNHPVEADEQLQRFLSEYPDYFETHPTVPRP